MKTENRGRQAERPSELTWPGWKDILVRTKEGIGKDNLSIVAGGVSFFMLLAIFPAIGALVAIYGLVADPGQIQQHLSALNGILPQQATTIINNQLSRVAQGAGGALGAGAAFGILFSLLSAAKGMKAVITGLNIVYGEEDERGFFKLNATALLFTIGAVLFTIVALGCLVVFPALLGSLGLSDIASLSSRILRWPLLACLIIGGLAILFRYGPDRDKPKFRWITWGSVAATGLWLIASFLFSFYVSRFGSYNETYGSLGAVIILLMWFYISAFAILAGGELNAEMEHQTRKDTTSDDPQPMGRRGARMADTVGHRTR